MDFKFIVTGGAGFIGNNIARALNESGCDDILIVDRLDGKDKERNLRRIRFRDYLDKDDFRKQCLRAGGRGARPALLETVFHLGACSSTTETDREYLSDNNFQYTRELCEWCMERNIRFVYASSAATYGDGSLGYSDADEVTRQLRPLNPYAESKHKFDIWALENKALDRIAGLKYFNVYGAGEDHKGEMRSMVNKAYGQILRTGEIKLFKSCLPDYADGEQERDFLYVNDAVRVTMFFHRHSDRSGIFNCGTGQARTWLDLARAVFTAMGREPKIGFIDMPETIRDKYQYHTCADISKLRRAGYTEPFISLEDGVRDYVANHLARGARI